MADLADQLPTSAGFLFDGAALGHGALVVPAQGGAQGARASPQEAAAMHPTGKTMPVVCEGFRPV